MVQRNAIEKVLQCTTPPDQGGVVVHESDRTRRQTVATSEITGHHTDDIEVNSISLPIRARKKSI